MTKLPEDSEFVVTIQRKFIDTSIVSAGLLCNVLTSFQRKLNYYDNSNAVYSVMQDKSWCIYVLSPFFTITMRVTHLLEVYEYYQKRNRIAVISNTHCTDYENNELCATSILTTVISALTLRIFPLALKNLSLASVEMERAQVHCNTSNRDCQQHNHNNLAW